MVQSVELLLDPDIESLVVADWARLADADLPNAGRNPSPSNRPHVTLFAAPSIPPEQEPALGALAGALPLTVRLGGIVLFGGFGRRAPEGAGNGAGARSEFVVARLVVASRALLELQSAVSAIATGTGVEPPPHLRPGEWTAHVTLARRLGPSQVAAALSVLPAGRDLVGEGLALRRWDGEQKKEWRLRAD